MEASDVANATEHALPHRKTFLTFAHNHLNPDYRTVWQKRGKTYACSLHQ